MEKGMAQRLQRYAAFITGEGGEISDRKRPRVISEDELTEMMNSLEDGTVLSVRFVKGGDDDE